MKHWLIYLLLIATIAVPNSARAGDESLNTAGKKGKIVAKAALYGFGGGLVVGVASQVFKRKPKNIFLFGSLGLYAGIALGLYVISTSGKGSTYDGPDTYEDYMGRLYRPEKSVAQNKVEALQSNIINVSF